jgi:hypothetical protein
VRNEKTENQIAYYQKHPPKCVAAFVAQPDWLENVQYDGHGASGRYPDDLVASPNIVFAIKCQCGSSTHHIIAVSEHEEIWRHKDLVIAEKYFLECSSCQSQHLLFDPALHGYNPETFLMEGLSLSDARESNQPSGKREETTCECSTCKNSTFEVFARFEYSADLFDEPEFAGKEQELFSWFTASGRCHTCSTVNVFMDFECA